MVDFNTRIFSEDDGKIIGAEITVYSDSGNKIGNISVADAETLEEMQAQLAVIDETYFTEARLQAILANTNENTPINATTLSGFLSSDFAKVSQLSNYAPLSHNHTKNQITDLYNYQITASKYNVDIDTDVTITVKVTNQLGQPVVGVNVPVLKDNETWKSGTTGVNGTFSLTYTADTWGLVMFSTNTTNTQINVGGWRVVHDDGIYYLKYNDKMVYASINYSTSVNWSTTIAHLGAEWLQDKNRGIDLRPKVVVSVSPSPNKNIILTNIDYRVGWFTNSGTATGGLYASFLYGRKP